MRFSAEEAQRGESPNVMAAEIVLRLQGRYRIRSVEAMNENE